MSQDKEQGDQPDRWSKLQAENARLRALLSDLVDLHDIDVIDGTIKTAKGSERWRRVEVARDAIVPQQQALPEKSK